jgi:hypothetical protein
MKRSLAIVLLLGTFLSACGESDEEQAQDAVCDARASGAKKQFQAALNQLADAYRQSFARVDCS